MYEQAKRLFLKLVRMPHDPDAPAGSPGSVRIFRASPRLYWLNLVEWGTLQLIVLLPSFMALIALAIATSRWPEWPRLAARIGLGLLALLCLLQLLLTFWMQKLDYEMRWYIVTDRSLRIRAGVWSAKEVTMTFANIQKVQVSQGPLQKLLNMASVVVSSAGGGAAGPHGTTVSSDSHAARFYGVDNAQEIRDVILERLRQYRDAGLGDSPAASAMAGEVENEEIRLAAVAVLEEARELRLALEQSRR